MVTVFTILQILACLFLIAVVLLQSGKSASLSGAVTGAAESLFAGKTQAKTLDAKLAKATKWVALVFAALSLTLSLIH